MDIHIHIFFKSCIRIFSNKIKYIFPSTMPICSPQVWWYVSFSIQNNLANFEESNHPGVTSCLLQVRLIDWDEIFQTKWVKKPSKNTEPPSSPSHFLSPYLSLMTQCTRGLTPFRVTKMGTMPVNELYFTCRSFHSNARLATLQRQLKPETANYR